jgi:hypothetical protein
MVAGAGCCDIKQLPFGCHDLVKLELVCDVSDAGTQRQHALIAGNDKHGSELKPFGKMHGANQNGLVCRIGMQGRDRGDTCCFGYLGCPDYLVVRTAENADL